VGNLTDQYCTAFKNIHLERMVEGIYDRHSFQHEKASALQQLAALVERIVNPPQRLTWTRFMD
jgi:hypothetical protein